MSRHVICDSVTDYNNKDTTNHQSRCNVLRSIRSKNAGLTVLLLDDVFCLKWPFFLALPTVLCGCVASGKCLALQCIYGLIYDVVTITEVSL